MSVSCGAAIPDDSLYAQPKTGQQVGGSSKDSIRVAGWYMTIELTGGLALQVSVRLSNVYNDFQFRAPQTQSDCNYKVDKQGVVYEHLLVHTRVDHHGVDLFGTLNSDQTIISWGTDPVTYWYSPKLNTTQNQILADTLLLQQPELI